MGNIHEANRSPELSLNVATGSIITLFLGDSCRADLDHVDLTDPVANRSYERIRHPLAS